MLVHEIKILSGSLKLDSSFPVWNTFILVQETKIFLGPFKLEIYIHHFHFGTHSFKGSKRKKFGEEAMGICLIELVLIFSNNMTIRSQRALVHSLNILLKVISIVDWI